jgi:tetratricopeptide (TPR) repeat protein
LHFLIELGIINKINQNKYKFSVKELKDKKLISTEDPSFVMANRLIDKDRKNHEEAIKWFKEAIKIDPHNVSVYNGIGECYQQQGNYEEAIKWFKEAIKLNPAHSNSYSGLGWTYKEQKNYEEAIKWFKEGIRAGPFNALNYYGISEMRSYMRKEEYSKIINLLYISAKRDPYLSNYNMIFKNKNHNRDIDDWVKSDIEKIVKICQKEGIRIILQNYPYQHRANESIKKVAEEYLIPFVDNCSLFNKLLKTERFEEYFVPDSHCNAKGYGIMAQNIYDKIMEEKIFNFKEK